MPNQDIQRTDNRERELRISLPWPDKHLSPNARCHWAVKAAAASRTRKAAWALTRQAIGPRRPHWDRVRLEVVFHPPDRRRIDGDNCIARSKSTFDGIADALGIDDSKFQTTYSIGVPVKDGAVHVTIGGAE